MNTIEIWKDIKGYEGLYQISSLGKVKSLKFGKEKILKPRKNTFGYLESVLCKNGNSKSFKIHRLVAEAFIPNPNNLPCVNHKNENKILNTVENLEWCTYKYNINYGTRNERVSQTEINDPNRSKQVYQYTFDKQLIKVWESINECKRNGLSSGNISQCCNGKRIQYKGYKWEFKPL